MKKTGTLNTHLSRIIAAMGHGDRLVICDAGLPIPRGKEVVDVALRPGLPGFLDVLDVVLSELEVERIVIADEMETLGAAAYTGLMERLGGVEAERVSHEAFKQLTGEASAVAFVRTGEATPYANVMLCSGVTF